MSYWHGVADESDLEGAKECGIDVMVVEEGGLRGRETIFQELLTVHEHYTAGSLYFEKRLSLMLHDEVQHSPLRCIERRNVAVVCTI